MSPKIRQSIYLAGTVVSGVLGIPLLWGGIDAGSAANIDQIVSGIAALFGSATSGVAAGKVTSQRKDGTFETTSPLEAVVQNIPVVVQAAAQAQADLDSLRGAALEAIGDLPVYGQEAQAAIDKFLPRF